LKLPFLEKEKNSLLVSFSPDLTFTFSSLQAIYLWGIQYKQQLEGKKRTENIPEAWEPSAERKTKHH